MLSSLCGVRRRVRPLAATHVCGRRLDEYALLDLLDSLVRKSLITAEHVEGHTRYRMLETIRQYAEDQLADTQQRSTGSPRVLFRRAGRRPLGDLGRAGATCRARLGGRRVRQPARRPSVGRPIVATSTRRPRSPPTPRCWLCRSSAMRRWLGRGAPRCGDRRRRHATSAPVYRRQLCGFIGRPGDGARYARSALVDGAEAGLRLLRLRLEPLLRERRIALLVTSKGAWTCAPPWPPNRLRAGSRLVCLLYGLPNVGRSEEARAIAERDRWSLCAPTATHGSIAFTT